MQGCIGRGARLVRCGPATVAPATPAPRPSLLSQFITFLSSHWPCLCSKQFHVPASLAGVRAVGLRFWALLPGNTAHMILSPGCGVYVVFHWMHWKGGEVTPAPSNGPSPCPATVSLTASARLNGICNRQ